MNINNLWLCHIIYWFRPCAHTVCAKKALKVCFIYSNKLWLWTVALNCYNSITMYIVCNSCINFKHRHRRNVTSYHSFSFLWLFSLLWLLSLPWLFQWNRRIRWSSWIYRWNKWIRWNRWNKWIRWNRLIRWNRWIRWIRWIRWNRSIRWIRWNR